MTYTEALEYIHGVSGVFCKPGLERISELCRGLGNPEEKLKFIHVGGTNGKGSVSAMTASILRAEGYRVGLYTSPYVQKFNERIRVNGENIPDDTLALLTERVRGVAEKMTDKPTEFEIITAIAFEYFLHEKCDVVVLEVGLGGRFDATNIIKNPLLSIITGIALDHTAILGDTVEKIAAEKAGIIKGGCPVLYGGEDKGAGKVIEAAAEKANSELFLTDYSALKVTCQSLLGTVFDYRMREKLTISLLGDYQPRNAVVVLEAVDILKTRGLNISENAVYEGLKRTRWEARFEIINENPLVIFDGAHNPQGVSAAVESIKKYFNEKVIIFSGVLRDKDYMQIARSICGVAECVFTITPDNPRALNAKEYADIYEKMGVSATPCESVEEALSKALLIAREQNRALCCLGSLYTYGRVAEVINRIKG